MSKNSKIKSTVEKISSRLSSEKISRLQICLENETIDKGSNIYDFIDMLDLSKEEIKPITRLFDYLDDIKIVPLLLEYNKEIRELKRGLEDSSSLVWTGPIIDGSVMHTFNTIVAMIREARSSITIVGYTIWNDPKDAKPSAAQIKKIFRELALASKKNVQIELFFDRDRNFKILRNSIRKMWTAGVPLPRLYAFNKKEKDSSLHAKTILIDDSEALITSANMTGRAVTRNIEFGVRVKGKVARNSRKLLEKLLDKGYFVEDNWQ